MSQSLYLVSNKTKIGVIRNTYERAVTEYQNSLNYIGFDEWLQANPMQSQKEMYKDMDVLIRLEDWEHELEELKSKIGTVFQGSALFDSMNIEENVMFPLKMFTNYSNDEIVERANFALKRVNLINVNKKMPSEASGGMQKRVAIARAIVNNPEYLFCDEPNSGLDPKTAIIIDNLIKEITTEYNIITVINSHDMNSVMEI